MQSLVVAKAEALAIAAKTHTSVAIVRKGCYDKPVEVFTNGEVIQTFLSQVRVGEPWRTLEGSPDRWFVCVSPIKTDYSRDSKNPTFVMGAMNVLQADSVDSRRYRAPKIASTNVRQLSFEAAGDIEDVQFK